MGQTTDETTLSATAVVIGKVDNPLSTTATFSYKKNNYLADYGTYDVPLDAANVFAAQFNIVRPTKVLLKYGSQTFKLYLSPNDTIQLRFNGKDPLKTMTIEANSKSAKAHNNYYLQSVISFNDWTDDSALQNGIETESAESYHRLIDQIYNQKKDFFDYYAYEEKDKFSPDFLNFATADIDYWWAYYLMLYYKRHGLNNANPDRRLSDAYFDFIYEVDNITTRSLYNDFYGEYLDLYIKYKQETDSNLRTLQAPQPIIEEKRKIERFIRPFTYTVRVLEDPFTPDKVVSWLTTKEEATYMSLATTERFRYFGQGKNGQADTIFDDYFYKIRTPESKIGWVPASAVLVTDRMVTTQTVKLRLCYDDNSPTCGFENLLQGKVLYYTLARDILLSWDLNKPQIAEQRIQNFVASNPYPEYSAILEKTLKTFKEDQASNFSKLRIPNSCEIAPHIPDSYNLNLVTMMRSIPLPNDTIPPINIGEKVNPTNTGAYSYKNSKGNNPSTSTIENTNDPSSSDLVVLNDSGEPYKPQEAVKFNGLLVNELAPAFLIRDINGKEIRQPDLVGKVVYIDFWASWCAPCKVNLTHARGLAERYEGQNIVFIFISIDTDENAWRNFLRDNPIKGIHTIDNSQFLRLNYAVQFLPNYFLIAKDGRIAINSMIKNRTNLDAMIEKLLK